MDLTTFVQGYLGKPNIGDTAGNMGQCVGLVEKWLDANNKPHIWGDAKDLMSQAEASVYKVVQNGPTNFPPAGAIVCWGASWGAGHGHTAIVVAANSLYLAVFEQNDPDGSPPTVATHGYSGVIGWMTW